MASSSGARPTPPPLRLTLKSYDKLTQDLHEDQMDRRAWRGPYDATLIRRKSSAELQIRLFAIKTGIYHIWTGSRGLQGLVARLGARLWRNCPAADSLEQFTDDHVVLRVFFLRAMRHFLCIAWPLLFAVAHAVRVPEDVQELAAQHGEHNGDTMASKISEAAPEKVGKPSQSASGASAMQTSSDEVLSSRSRRVYNAVHRRRGSRPGWR
ncbi:CPK2 [Symbiodinium sp. CCMP2592]|nr:CPK2 [Symbiodinium sp. CCMP2592]